MLVATDTTTPCSADVRRVVAAPAGGFELSAKADGLLLRLSSGVVRGLEVADAELSGWRLLLEASYRGVPLLGGPLAPAWKVYTCPNCGRRPGRPHRGGFQFPVRPRHATFSVRSVRPRRDATAAQVPQIHYCDGRALQESA